VSVDACSQARRAMTTGGQITWVAIRDHLKIPANGRYQTQTRLHINNNQHTPPINNKKA